MKRTSVLSHDYRGDDFRFPALECRTKSFREFRNAHNKKRMNLEGIFIYKKAYPRRSKNPQVYIGHLDQKKEYYNLDLRVPEKEMMKIPCFIPSDLVRREDLNSKNLRLRGVVEYDPVNDRKIFMAEHVDVCDIKYIEVGPPALGNYEDIFTYVYERQREVFEGEPTLLFAGLIGSDVGSSYTSDENPGCGVGIGIVEEASSGSGRIPIATKNVLRDFSYFVRRISPVRINSQNPSFEWWRYVSTNLSGDVASRKLKNEKEIDWNVISNVKEISASRSLSPLSASDINLPFENDLIPNLKKYDAKNVKQTLLFLRSIDKTNEPRYNAKKVRIRQNETINKIKKGVEHSPFLFRLRLEPLFNAFIKGKHLEDYASGNEVIARDSEIREFFKISGKVAQDFIAESEPFIDTSQFYEMIDYFKDGGLRKDLIGLYCEIRSINGMTKGDMLDFLTGKYGWDVKRAMNDVDNFINLEPAVLVRRGEYYHVVI